MNKAVKSIGSKTIAKGNIPVKSFKRGPEYYISSNIPVKANANFGGNAVRSNKGININNVIDADFRVIEDIPGSSYRGGQPTNFSSKRVDEIRDWLASGSTSSPQSQIQSPIKKAQFFSPDKGKTVKNSEILNAKRQRAREEAIDLEEVVAKPQEASSRFNKNALMGVGLGGASIYAGIDALDRFTTGGGTLTRNSNNEKDVVGVPFF